MANALMKTSNESNLSAAQEEMITAICKAENIPITGITLMGGKPYINVTGLDRKIENLCKEKNLVKVGVSYEEIQQAKKDNGMRAAGWGIVKLFDKEGFETALDKLGSLDLETIKELKTIYVHVFKMRGWASPETLKMSTMKNNDNIEMMAERRATNRAKREATSTGLTSIDEIGMIHEKNGGKPAVKPPQSKSAKTTNGDEDIALRAKLEGILNDLKGEGTVSDLVAKYSSFIGKDKKDVPGRDSLDKLNGKWLTSTYGKAKTAWEKAGFNQPEKDPLDDIPNFDEE